MHKWQLYEAKNRLSQIIDVVEGGEPQCITRKGRDAAVIISIKDYQQLQKQQIPFNEFLIMGQKIDDFEVERVSGQARSVEL